MNTICTNKETETHEACTNASTKEIPKLEHSYTGEYKRNEADKTHSQMCVNGCEAYGNATDCTFNPVVTDPTCDAKGYTTHTCTVCNYSYTDNETTRVHVYVYATGNGTHHEVSCEYDNCTYIATEACAGGTATCTAKAVCTKCNTEYGEALDHNYTVFVEKIPYTCTTGGYDIYKCSRCTETTHKNPTSAAHTLTQVEAKEPTCGEVGWNAYEYCTKCNYTTKSEIPATEAHVYAIEVEGTKVASTCNTKGSVTKKCVCGAEKTTDLELDANNHSTTETYVDGYVAPTCTTPGATGDTKYACCNAVKVASTEIPVKADAHTGEANVVKNKSDATCTSTGYTGDTYWSCCDTLAAAGETIDVDANAHTTDKTHVDGYVAPTCTTPGATGDTKYDCCNAVKVANTEIAIDANAHSTDKTYVDGYKAPTCTTPGATGTTKLKCCNAVIEASTVIPVNADAHTGTANVKKNESKETCMADGYTGDTCWSCCGKISEKGITINAIPHKDENGDDLCDYNCGTLMTSCKHEGPKQYIATLSPENKLNTHKIKCLECGQIVKTENCSYDEDDIQVFAPTCYAEGYTAYICKVCEYSYISDITAKTEHNFSDWTSNNAKCNEIQTMSRRCKESRCLYKETIKVVDETTGKYAYGPHSLVIVPGKAATCTKAGYTDYSICVNCEEVTESTVIPAKGHIDANDDGNCDTCNYLMSSKGECGCYCHGDSFFDRLIFKIASFFWKLFKINANCQCGAKHW